MEAHFVHSDKDGNLAVIAVMFMPGEKNAELEKAWAHMPEHTGEEHSLPSMINAQELLPHNRDYYRFNGSLTTPPYSEGIWWIVMKYFETASKAQLEKFTHTMHHPNNRLIQPINARMIVQ
jgi:carbonic anhydrase